MGTRNKHHNRDAKFPGFQLYKPENLGSITETCKTALSEKILCDGHLATINVARMEQYIKNRTLYNSVCNKECGQSLDSWFDNVSQNYGGQTIGRAKATKVGGHIYTNYSLTCLKNPSSDSYCLEDVVEFPLVNSVQEITKNNMCLYCFSTLLAMRQASSYTAFTLQDQQDLKYIQKQCDLAGPTKLHNSLLVPDTTPDAICASNNIYTTNAGDTCDTIAIKHNLASASIIFSNPTIIANCSALPISKQLCLPFACVSLYILQETDTCWSIEHTHSIDFGTVRKYNLWLNTECTDLHRSREILGRIICLSPQAGEHDATGDAATPAHSYNRYMSGVEYPPENATVATGTTDWCGCWHTALHGQHNLRPQPALVGLPASGAWSLLTPTHHTAAA
ncbi:hypothetical protein BJX63DRAFT_436737 [Aspergillus granulosus]|uniref:LysM domain-containing protein n=1 Tax=Aspergillus granulosus TaxID=176169 RepID=A0ABR4GXB7_9EURO